MELVELTATQAVAAMKAGDITAEAYAAALLARAAALKFLNASDLTGCRPGPGSGTVCGSVACCRWRAPTPTRTAPASEGNINTAVLPTTAGTPGLRNNRPRHDAPVAAALFRAGGILFGKANWSFTRTSSISTGLHSRRPTRRISASSMWRPWCFQPRGCRRGRSARMRRLSSTAN